MMVQNLWEYYRIWAYKNLNKGSWICTIYCQRLSFTFSTKKEQKLTYLLQLVCSQKIALKVL